MKEEEENKNNRKEIGGTPTKTFTEYQGANYYFRACAYTRFQDFRHFNGFRPGFRDCKDLKN